MTNNLSTFFLRDVIALVLMNALLMMLMGDNVWMKEQDGNGLKAIRLNLMADEKPGEITDKFTQRAIDSVLVGKKITNIYLDNCDCDDYSGREQFLSEARNKFIFREMERITFSELDNEVLAVHLNNLTTIGEWLILVTKALDINMRRFAYSPDHDMLYFFGNSPKERNQYRVY